MIRVQSEKGTDLDPELDQELLFETYGAEYLAYKFPGAIISPLAMVDQMTSRNPDSLVEAEVVVKGDDFDLCDFATGTGNSTDNGITDVADEDKCQSGLQLDPDYQMCYGGLGQMDYGRAKTVCAEKYGRPFDLDGSADQLSTVRDLFVNGEARRRVGQGAGLPDDLDGLPYLLWHKILATRHNPGIKFSVVDLQARCRSSLTSGSGPPSTRRTGTTSPPPTERFAGVGVGVGNFFGNV